MIQHSTFTVFELFNCYFRVIDSDQRLKAYVYSRNELDFTDFSIANAYLEYDKSNNGAASDISGGVAKQSCLWPCYTGVRLSL